MSTDGKTLKFRAAKLKGFTVIFFNVPRHYLIFNMHKKYKAYEKEYSAFFNCTIFVPQVKRQKVLNKTAF